MTVPHALGLTGLSRTELYRELGRDGTPLRARKFGRRTLIEYSSLQALIASKPIAQFQKAL